MTAHVLSNIPEQCKNIIENIEDELYENIYPGTIKLIRDKILSK